MGSKVELRPLQKLNYIFPKLITESTVKMLQGLTPKQKKSFGWISSVNIKKK